MAFAHGSEVSSDPQAEFTAGVAAMFAGQHDKAMTVFSALYKKTRSPRVKLEWARAAFLAKEHDLSRQLFSEVLLDNPPDIVRFNISLYLGEIAKLGNSTDYGFSYVRDSNPFAFSKPQTVTIYGMPFSYRPPRTQETLQGVNAYIIHSRTLNTAGTVRAMIEAEDTEYSGQDNSKSSFKLSLETRLSQENNWSIKTGLDAYLQRRELLLYQPFVGLGYRKDQMGGLFHQVQLDLRHGRNIYPDFSSVNGTFQSINIQASKNLDPKFQLGSAYYADESTSSSASSAYKTQAHSVFVRFFTPLIRSNTKINYTRSTRLYNGVDELFLVRRKDDRTVFSLAIQPYSLRLAELYPSIEFGREVTDSSIPINGYQRNFISLLLKRNY